MKMDLHARTIKPFRRPTQAIRLGHMQAQAAPADPPRGISSRLKRSMTALLPFATLGELAYSVEAPTVTEGKLLTTGGVNP